MNIKKIRAREVLDSRGNPTVEADVILENGTTGRAIVPSGASTGQREALELRDGDKKRYLGKGVLKAVGNINTKINTALAGTSIDDQAQLDQIMIDLDNCTNKENLGANAILAVSLACAHTRAKYQNQPLYQSLANGQAPILPVPMMNIINGGKHANNNIDVQEFMIIPAGAPSFCESVRYGVEIFQHLGNILQNSSHSTTVGDEGGFAPNLTSNQAALDIIMQAIETAGFVAGKDIYIGLDCASSELYKDGFYHLDSEGEKLTATEFIAYLENWVDNYPIISIEDGLDENDWQGWQILSQKLGTKIQLVGDDLMTTNSQTLIECIKQGIANSILIKVNQIGCLTQALEAVNIAQAANYTAIISHRSGESEDTTIADLAVATACGQIKTGSLSRSDRLAKYNQLLRIEEQLGTQAIYPGLSAFNHLK